MPHLPGAPLSPAQLHSMWSLLAQDEFSMLMIMRNSTALPQLIGSCGHAYAVSSFPPSSLFSLLRSSHSSWADRVRTALGFITLEKQLAMTPYGTLGLCDVKPGNFGVRPRKECRSNRLTPRHDGAMVGVEEGGGESLDDCKEYDIQAIDTDMSFFPERLKETLGQGPCTSDEECDFFDCHASCDTARHQCAETRTNSNMQVSNLSVYRFSRTKSCHSFLYCHFCCFSCRMARQISTATC